jgi:hypothetical protein
VAGFACGLLAGAAVALILAPAPGRDARGWIAAQGREARRRTGRLLHTEQATAIIRKSGILGLAEVLRRTRSDPEAASAASEQPEGSSVPRLN